MLTPYQYASNNPYNTGNLEFASKKSLDKEVDIKGTV